MSAGANVPSARSPTAFDRAFGVIPPAVVELVPESVAREHVIMPVAFDGETITILSVDAESIALTDKLRFVLAKNVRLIPADRQTIVNAIQQYYGAAETESVESALAEFSDADLDEGERSAARRFRLLPELGRHLGKGIVQFKKGIKGLEDETASSAGPGLDSTPTLGGTGMFFYVVEEGQRVVMRRPNGTIEILVGPRRVWRGWRTFHPMRHFVASPGKFLLVRYRNGQQRHLPGPAEIWFDPREHLEIVTQDALQLATKEAVVVYSKPDDHDAIARRIVFGPTLFIPAPGEWLHTFSWHASKGGSLGVQKQPNALVFQKLWLMPDQMYHDVIDVRTADDAVLTIRLMIFFELVDIERMLDTTHDPIGDFVNAATSDVVGFTGRHDFESFKRNTSQLNELDAYKQLAARAAQCGYRINKVVYRGYGAAEALQQMHDQAIQARTRLQLDRATEQQAQELENFKLDAQLARAARRRTEQTAEVAHDLELAGKRQDAELRQRGEQESARRERLRLEADLQAVIRRAQDEQQREHLASLRELGVDLTAYLTQARADRVIELRGAGGAHVHLDPQRGRRPAPKNDGQNGGH
ncbi:MAG TPA: twin-arginine translocase TatA/TatE family subunit [Gemmataceae bacterium]